jgi:hypothetical protein
MIRRCLPILLLAALAAESNAQVPPADPPAPAPDAPPPPPAEPAPVAEPAPPPPAPPPPPRRDLETPPSTTIAHEPEPAPEPPSPRPDRFTVGFGIGYDFPSDLQVPDITSVRFRLRSGLTFEPFFSLVGSTQTTEQDTMTVETSSAGFSIGGQVRYPVAARHRFELSALGGAGFATVAIDPDGDENTYTQAAFSVVWGLGLDVWIRGHWSVNLSATNPLLALQSETQETLGAPDTTTKRTVYGLTFDPNLVAMVHVFF